jgi:hypothetical protein
MVVDQFGQYKAIQVQNVEPNDPERVKGKRRKEIIKRILSKGCQVPS